MSFGGLVDGRRRGRFGIAIAIAIVIAIAIAVESMVLVDGSIKRSTDWME
jgi:hypothetical protein